MPGSQKPRAKCECHEVIKDLGPGMIQKFIKNRPTCTYKTKTDRVIKRLKRKADIWEQPLALWCVIRNKMLQAAFAAPNINALVEVYLEKQSATVRKVLRKGIGKLKLNDIHSGKLSDQMQQHLDNVVKIVIHSMSKYEMQLILITSIWRSKVNRAVQLHILALFLAFIGEHDLSDYPYLETVVGADSLPTDPTDLSEKLLRALFETPRRKQQKSREEQSNGRVENMPWFGNRTKTKHHQPQPGQTATPLIHNQHQQQPHQQGHTPYMAHQHQGQHQPQHTPTHQHQHQHALLPQTSNHASTTLHLSVQFQLVQFGILCDQDYHPTTVLDTVRKRFLGDTRFCTYDGLVNQQSPAPLVRVFKEAFKPPDCQVVSATLVFQNASWSLTLLDQLGSTRYKCVHIVITVHPGGSAPAWGHIAALVMENSAVRVPGHNAGTIYTYDPQKGSAYPKAHHKGGAYGSFYELLRSGDVALHPPASLNPDHWNWPDPHGLVGTGLQEWLEIGKGGTRVQADPKEAGTPWWCKAENVSCNTCPQVDRGGMCVTLVVLMTVLCSTLKVWNMPLVSQTAQQVLEAYLNLQRDNQNITDNPARAILRRRIFHWVLDRYYGDLGWSGTQACIPRH